MQQLFHPESHWSLFPSLSVGIIQVWSHYLFDEGIGACGGSNSAQYKWLAELATTYGPTYIPYRQKLNIEFNALVWGSLMHAPQKSY